MQRFEQAKAAILGLTVEQKVLFAAKAADAVFARRPGVAADHRALWAAFLEAPFGEGRAREVAVGFPCDPRSDEHLAAQRAAAAALQLERGDAGQAAWLAERSLEHAFAAERGGELIDLEGLTEEAHLAAPPREHAAE
ncbi:MAG TPA: hypothetical protein VFS43_08335 [Polyangiaceae bacterium]|nr:hypothetical protein [Polyangiaceae bacterium]